MQHIDAVPREPVLCRQEIDAVLCARAARNDVFQSHCSLVKLHQPEIYLDNYETVLSQDHNLILQLLPQGDLVTQ